jgi:hypothetical protein
MKSEGKTFEGKATDGKREISLHFRRGWQDQHKHANIFVVKQTMSKYKVFFACDE